MINHRWTILKTKPEHPIKVYRYKFENGVWIMQMTQKELAKKLGVAKQTLQKIENDVYPYPTIEFMCRYLALTNREEFFKVFDYYAEKHRS